MIFIYPVGIFLMFIYVSSQKLENDNSNANFKKAMFKGSTFLKEPYKSKYSYFESYELFRKFLMTAIFSLVNNYFPNLSVVYFAIICTVSIALQLYCKPYKEVSNGKVAEASTFLHQYCCTYVFNGPSYFSKYHKG